MSNDSHWPANAFAICQCWMKISVRHPHRHTHYKYEYFRVARNVSRITICIVRLHSLECLDSMWVHIFRFEIFKRCFRDKWGKIKHHHIDSELYYVHIYICWVDIEMQTELNNVIESSIKPECNYLEMHKWNGNKNFGFCSTARTTTGKKTDVILKERIIHKHILLLHADLFKHSKYSHLKVKFRSLELNHIKSRYQQQHIKTIRIKNNTYMNICARVCCVYNNSVLYGFHQFTRCHDPFMSWNKMLSILSIPNANANANGTNEWVTAAIKSTDKK